MDFDLTKVDELLDIDKDARVSLGAEMTELLNSELCLGQTRYVCRHGTLSDGHEAVNDSIRYYRCIREIYQRAGAVKELKHQAMLAKADLIEGKEEIVTADSEPKKIRAEAKVYIAKERIFNTLVNYHDSIRQLDEFVKIYKELQPIVRAKYPGGIEQAEPNNWKDITRYRIEKRKTGFYNEALTHTVLDPLEKARLGVETGEKDLTLYLKIKEKEALKHLAGDSVQELIDVLDEQKRIKLDLISNTKGE